MESIKKFLKRYWLWIISFIYILWPVDFISDIFGPVGLVDDAAMLFWAVVYELRVKKRGDQQQSGSPKTSIPKKIIEIPIIQEKPIQGSNPDNTETKTE